MLSQDIIVPIKISSHGKMENCESAPLQGAIFFSSTMACHDAHLVSVKFYLKHINTDKFQSTEKREGKSPPTPKEKQGRTVLMISEAGEEVEGG